MWCMVWINNAANQKLHECHTDIHPKLDLFNQESCQLTVNDVLQTHPTIVHPEFSLSF